jgi:hypothetical protein
MSSRLALSGILLCELTDEADLFGALARVARKCGSDQTHFGTIAARTGCIDGLQGVSGAGTLIPHAATVAP